MVPEFFDIAKNHTETKQNSIVFGIHILWSAQLIIWDMFGMGRGGVIKCPDTK